MGTPFLSEIRAVSFNFAPKGWALCNGQTLPINQNQALFALLGTTYGGDGRTTFLLPNLQGRAPLHMGAGFTLGEATGQESHTIIQSEMPAHTHTPQANGLAGNTSAASGTLLAQSGANPIYRASASNATTLAPGTVSNAGGSQPHENRQPFLVLTFVIALQGIFPSRN